MWANKQFLGIKWLQMFLFLVTLFAQQMLLLSILCVFSENFLCFWVWHNPYWSQFFFFFFLQQIIPPFCICSSQNFMMSCCDCLGISDHLLNFIFFKWMFDTISGRIFIKASEPGQLGSGRTEGWGGEDQKREKVEDRRNRLLGMGHVYFSHLEVEPFGVSLLSNLKSTFYFKHHVPQIYFC